MKPIIKELNIPEEILDQCKEIMNDKKSPLYKRNSLRDLLGITFCASCRGLPELEVSYDYGDGQIPFKRIEHYCKSCYDEALEREREEPQTRESLAAYYGCIKSDCTPQ